MTPAHLYVSQCTVTQYNSDQFEIIKTGLEVVERGLLVIDISTVAQRIVSTQSGCHRTGGRQDLAPCVISILNNCRAAGIQDGSNVALYIGGIVVVRAVVGDRQRRSRCVVGKVQGVAAHGHLAQTTAVVDIVIGGGTVGPLGSQTVCIVGIRPGGAAIGHRCQLTAMLPGICPGAVRQHVANGITGNGLAVVASQQITPCGITIGVVDGALCKTKDPKI